MNSSAGAAINPSRSYTAILQNSIFEESGHDNGRDISPEKDVICINIDQEIYYQHLTLCKTPFIGRLLQLKGDKPWKFMNLKALIQDI